MNTQQSRDSKHPNHPGWLDPYAVLTDEEEAALDAIYAQMDPAKVRAADRETHAQAHAQHELPPDDAA